MTTNYLGYEARFTRRRYGGTTTTYTWVEVNIDGEWVDLGDPWPAVVPARAEVEAMILYRLEQRSKAA